MLNPAAQIVVAAGMYVLTVVLAAVHIYLRRRDLSNLGLTEEERKRIKDITGKPYLGRAFDILTFLLFAAVAQLIVLRLRGGCPLKETYPRILYFASLSLAPFALGYVWKLFPWGRRGDVEAEVVRLGKAEPTTLSRLERILWRPWLGVFYWVFYTWGAFCVYLSVGY